MAACSHFRGAIMSAKPAAYNDLASTVTMTITTFFA